MPKTVLRETNSAESVKALNDMLAELYSKITKANVGPGASVIDNLPIFADDLGRTLKDSGKQTSDFAPADHVHSWASLTLNIDGGATASVAAAANAKEVLAVFRKGTGYYLPIHATIGFVNLAVGGAMADNTRASFVINKTTWVITNTSPAGTSLVYFYYR